MRFIISDVEEIRKYAPVNINFNPLDHQSSFLRAENEVRDIVGKEIFDLALSFKYSSTAITDEWKNRLVELIQAPVANFALYFRFIWLIINTGSSSISITSNDGQKPLNKGQIIEAKEDLLQTAWVFMADLIDFLNENAETIVKVIKTEGQEDVTEKVWKDSEQYNQLKNLVFTGYKEFDRLYGTDKSAVFFFRAIPIMRQIIRDEIVVRTGVIDPILTPTEPAVRDETLIDLIKQFLAFRTVSIACRRMSIEHLPASIRGDMDKESISANKDDKTIRERISAMVNQDAETYLRSLDYYLASKIVPPEGDTVLTTFSDRPDANDKFVALL